MARTQLMEFKHDGKNVKVFTGESSADVYFSVNGGSSRATGLRWNENRGDYKSGSGATISNDQAKMKIREQISD